MFCSLLLLFCLFGFCPFGRTSSLPDYADFGGKLLRKSPVLAAILAAGHICRSRQGCCLAQIFFRIHFCRPYLTILLSTSHNPACFSSAIISESRKEASSYR